MSPSSDQSRTPLDAFLAAFRADIEAAAIRPLPEYLTRFPGDPDQIAREYLAFKDGSKPETSADRIAHYRILRQLGHGGQATVYLAEDTLLHRKVALKVMTGLGRLEGDSLNRFHREAAVASKLDHPGICGVHEAGVEGGVAYIAMRYVEGETLASKIAASRFGSEGDRSAESFVVLSDAGKSEAMAQGSAASSSRSTRQDVLKVAETIERAARALHEAHEAGIVHRDIKPGNIMLTPKGDPVVLDFGLARDLEGDDPTLTRTGDLFGTPAYMAPEQLMAQRVRIDRRADVWALGVTLYEALTLTRPFDAPTREGVYQAIQFKDPARPSKLNPSIPSDLEVVIATALEKDPDRRYHSAEAFAEDLRRAREGEPTLAKPVSMAGRAWRWAKRRPARAALFVSLVIGIPTVATLAGVLWASLDDLRAQKLRKQRDELEHHLEEGFLAIHESRQELAVQDFEAALAIDPRDPETLAGLAFAKSESKDDAGGLAVLERSRDLEENPGLLRVHQWILRRLGRPGLPNETLPRLRTAADFFLAGYSILHENWGANDGHPGFKEAFGLLDRAVSRSSAKRLLYHLHRTRAASRALDAAAARAGADDLIEVWPNQAYAWFGRGFALRNLDPDQSIAAFRHAQELRESPLFLRVLGSTLTLQGKSDDAIAALREAIRLKPGLVEDYNFLGAALNQKGLLDDAVAAFREAIRLKPDHAFAHSNLGLALVRKGLLDEAISSHREAVRLKPDSAAVHANLAAALVQKGLLDEALAANRDAIRVQPDDAASYVGLASTFVKKELFDDAIAAYREAIRLKPDYAEAHNDLGAALVKKRLFDDAILAFRESIRLRPDSAETQANLGAALCEKGLFDASIVACREAIRLKPDYADAHGNLGVALERKGLFEEAILSQREAIRLKPDVATNYANLSRSLFKKGLFDASIVACREAIRLKPDYAEAHGNLGVALERKGLFEEAILSQREAIRLKPDYAEAHYGLAVALAKKDHLDDAVAALREAIRLKPDYAEAYFNFGVLLQMQKRGPDDAIAALRESIRLKPDFAEPHAHLGFALSQQGFLDEAIAACREAIRLKPTYAEAYKFLGNALLQNGLVRDGVAALREAIRLKPDMQVVHYTLGNALVSEGFSDDAIAAYREAIRLKPDMAEAHCNLGGQLRLLLQFRESLAEYRRGHAIGSAQPGWRYPSEQWVTEAEQLLAEEEALEAQLEGHLAATKPENEGKLATLARVALGKGHPALAVRWFRLAFEEAPEIAGSPTDGHRRIAARAAMLASLAGSEPESRPDDQARTAYRLQALGWLEAEVAAVTEARLIAQGVRMALVPLTRSPDFTSVREKNALAMLPDAERARWTKLWADVDALLAALDRRPESR